MGLFSSLHGDVGKFVSCSCLHSMTPSAIYDAKLHVPKAFGFAGGTVN